MADLAFDVDPFSEQATRKEINIVPMNFRTDFRPDPKEPGKTREIDMVDLVKRGTNGESTTVSIRELQRDRVLWDFVEPYYDKWKADEDMPVEGTPIEMLTFLGDGVTNHLKSLNIRSAEDFCEINDAALERIGMGARRWQERARAYLETRGDVATATELTDLRSMMEALQEENEDLRKQINSLGKKK